MKRIRDYDDIQPFLERLTADKGSGEIELVYKGWSPHSFWQTYSSFFTRTDHDEHYFLVSKFRYNS